MEFCLNIFNPDIDTSTAVVSPSKPTSIPPPTSPTNARKVDLAHEVHYHIEVLAYSQTFMKLVTVQQNMNMKSILLQMMLI